MTETQNINHRAPLKPGEIRTHQVGAQVFQVMHIAGGSFAQASVAGNGMATRVLRTDRFADVAVRAYADAIEQAESDAIDALDDADGPSFDASGAYLDGEPEKSLADLLNAYGEQMARGGIELSYAFNSGLSLTTSVAVHAERADALKAEILARFGGGR